MNNYIHNQPFTGAYSICVPVAGYEPGSRVYLPDTPVLQDKYITAIDVFYSTQGSPVLDPEGREISGLDHSNIYLTLTDLQNVDFFSKVPLNYFSQGGKQLPINRYMFLPNCYLSIGSANPGTYAMMTFYYTDKTSNNPVIEERHPSFQGVEVPVYTDTFNQFFIPDNRILVDKGIINILTTEDATGLASSPAGKPLINPRNAFLTLIWHNDIVLYRVPLSYLSQWYTPFKLHMDRLKVDLPSSYIELSRDILPAVGDKAVYLNFEYES